ncbi:hypothetical protein [Sulfurimonas sp.]|uniref:hypothetical protein n=1 Tax=Sulfurimonas sp. TaxID=2022749 RepID=UPI002627FF9A|nr:hypothetical protein [Sulfurimonas sp.]MDD3854118.1 hypothetical protein [Sulfurimonas sp.]
MIGNINALELGYSGENLEDVRDNMSKNDINKQIIKTTQAIEGYKTADQETIKKSKRASGKIWHQSIS